MGSTDRRQVIVEAAAELLGAGDGERLTHRRVAEHAQIPLGSTTYYFTSLDDLRTAALEHLADCVDADLAETAQLIADSDGSPEAIAALFYDYLCDTARMKNELVIYVAALDHPELRPLSMRWFNGLVDILSTLTTRSAATMMAVFVDGATMHAVINDAPLPLQDLQNLTRSLMTPNETKN